MGMNLRYSPLEWNSADEKLEFNGRSTSTDEFMLEVTMADVSTAASVWVVCPYAAKIKKAYSVINGAIATAPAVITAEIATVAVTGFSISITHTSSAAGDVDSCTPTALNSVTAGQAIEIITSGASTNTIIGTFTLVMQRI